MSVGHTSPNLTSNFLKTSSTETSVPIASNTSAALPRTERLRFVSINASWYMPVLQILSTSLRHWAYDGSFLFPSPENAANLGGTGAA